MATLVATKEKTLTHTIIFDIVQITLSGTKKHKTPAIERVKLTFILTQGCQLLPLKSK